MEQKSPYLIIAVAAIFFVIAVIWLLIIFPTPESNIPPPRASKQSAADLITQTADENLQADFAEIDQLNQEIEEIDISEDDPPRI